VLHKPMKQSALLDALTIQWTPGTIRLHTPEVSKSPAAATATGQHHHHLLLAEDNPVNQRVAASMLHKLGYGVDVVCDGNEALAAIAQRHYDAILMDCQMPGMDGYAATRLLRRQESESAQGGHLPVIAMTANAMEGDRELCLAAGMDDYLAKPIEYARLKTLLEHWLPQQAASAAPVSEARGQVQGRLTVQRLTEFLGDDPAGIAEMLDIFRDSAALARTPAAGHASWRTGFAATGARAQGQRRQCRCRCPGFAGRSTACRRAGWQAGCHPAHCRAD
jgi:CheY-like chemotaxis protein